MAKNKRVINFLKGLFGAIVLAIIWPDLGRTGGYLHTEILTKIGVFLVFLVQGLLLPTEKIIEDLKDWKAHLYTQAFIFVIFPLCLLPLISLLEPVLGAELSLGFRFICLLPTTIFTASAFTTQTGGSVIVSVFNSSLSNILAVFIIPAWGAYLLNQSAEVEVPYIGLLQKICLMVLLPFVLGQCLRPYLRELLDPIQGKLNQFNTYVVFMIVCSVFSNAVYADVFTSSMIYTISLSLFTAFIFLAIIMTLTWFLSTCFISSFAVRKAVFFCSNQKSLATGLPMANLVFSFAPLAIQENLGQVLLPLMSYHLLQLTVAGLLSPYLSKLR